MPWTETARRKYQRDCPRYAIDLTDREWALIEPFIPPPRRFSRPRKTDLREVVNTVLNMASAGCQWKLLPKNFPPISTVQRFFISCATAGCGKRSDSIWPCRRVNGRDARLSRQQASSTARR